MVGTARRAPLPTLRRRRKWRDPIGPRHIECCQVAPAFCAYSQEACDSGTVRFADSMALALAAVPSRMRPAMPWVMPARRNRLYEKYQLRSGTVSPVALQ